ncbi:MULTISPECIES: hypothetical protein [unclassified Rhodococcus (in: high G+C Gram-positive bacteria)]|uniref:hypothetical protein n=1 Tax=unclassified Rhodococcus (in: high G+C Gram-positive bacteria) TaxID=192944 RepID=UPI00117BA644|nr:MULTISPECIES: hypothetical protein [unclassified Rhodococcus (in: high G+C Gram-positive bacteria)]
MITNSSPRSCPEIFEATVADSGRRRSRTGSAGVEHVPTSRSAETAGTESDDQAHTVHASPRPGGTSLADDGGGRPETTEPSAGTHAGPWAARAEEQGEDGRDSAHSTGPSQNASSARSRCRGKGEEWNEVEAWCERDRRYREWCVDYERYKAELAEVIALRRARLSALPR